MVSFRFYLVSITAVFLALALGITMGATVIKEATVSELHRQIRTAEADRRATDEKDKLLEDQASRSDDFENGSAATLASDRLTNAPVVLVATKAADDHYVNDMKALLVAAGADVQGTVWFTGKLKLDKPGDAAALAEALNVAATTPPDTLRATALSRIVTASTTAEITSQSVNLKQLSAIQYDPGSVKDLSVLPKPGSRFVIIATAKPEAPDEQVAIPFTQQLARQLPYRIVAAEAGVDAQAKQPEVREVFVGPLRSNDLGVNGELSTVDNIDYVRGRLAVVFALQSLPAQKTGHYGVGPHADAPFPPP